MALSDIQRKANDKYIAKNYERLPISYNKEFCEKVRQCASDAGETLAGYVRKAIEMRMNSGKDNADASQTE
jgi:predicted DNA-binding protein